MNDRDKIYDFKIFEIICLTIEVVDIESDVRYVLIMDRKELRND